MDAHVKNLRILKGNTNRILYFKTVDRVGIYKT